MVPKHRRSTKPERPCNVLCDDAFDLASICGASPSTFSAAVVFHPVDEDKLTMIVRDTLGQAVES